MDSFVVSDYAYCCLVLFSFFIVTLYIFQYQSSGNRLWNDQNHGGKGVLLTDISEYHLVNWPVQFVLSVN